MKKKILYEEFMDKGLVGMNLKETNENEVKMDKPQQIQKNEQIFLKHKKSNDERKKKSRSLEKCCNLVSKSISNLNGTKNF